MIFVNGENIEIENNECFFDKKELADVSPNICVLMFDSDIFGVKFIKHILDKYPSAKVTVVVGQGTGEKSLHLSKTFLDRYSERIKTYNEDTTKTVVLEEVHDIFFFCPFVNLDRELHFKVPSKIQKKFSEKLEKNTYAFKEHHFKINENQEETITELIINNIPVTDVIDLASNEEISLCYFCTNRDVLENSSISVESPGYKLGWQETWAIATFDLVISLDSYLYDLDMYSDQTEKDITILLPNDTLENLQYFFELPEIADVTEDYLHVIEMLVTYGKEYYFTAASDMRTLFEQSCPVVFLSGEKSITEYLFSRDDFYCDVYYQMMEKDLDFSQYVVDLNVSTSCFMIDRNKLKKFKHSSQPFYKELNIIDSAIEKALKSNTQKVVKKNSNTKASEATSLEIASTSSTNTTIIVLLSVILGILVFLILVYGFYRYSR